MYVDLITAGLLMTLLTYDSCLHCTSVDVQVAQLTYPVLLMRYDAILKAYSQEIQQNTEGKDRLQLDETLCVLEVCAAMTIAPSVADSALQLGSLQQVGYNLMHACNMFCVFKNRQEVPCSPVKHHTLLNCISSSQDVLLFIA